MSGARGLLTLRGVALLGAALALAGAAGLGAQARLIDGDEGYFALAARLVAEGQRPMRDWFFPQGPLLPLVSGAWSLVWGATWPSLRGLAALLALGTLALVAVLVRGVASTREAAAAVVLTLCAGPFLGWFTVLKTYGLATVLLLWAYALLRRSPAERATQVAFAAGALVGLATMTRLYVVVALPVFLAWRAEGEAWRGWAKRGLALASGSLVPVVALLAWTGATPDALSFNLLEYHALRTSSGLIGDVEQKGRVLLMALGLGGVEWASGLQVLALVLLAAWRWRGRVRGVGRRQALTVAAVLAVTSLLPTPTYPQYFAVVIPFLVVGLAEQGLLAATPGRWLTVGLLAWAGLGAVEGVRYFSSGEAVPGVASAGGAQGLTMAAVRGVSAQVDAQVTAGREIYACWPGFLLESSARPLAGTENQFSLKVASQLAPARRASLHLRTRDEVLEAVSRGGVPALLGVCQFGPGPLAEALRTRGLTETQVGPQARLYQAAPPRESGPGALHPE